MPRFLLFMLLLLAFFPCVSQASEPVVHALRATFRITQGTESGTAFVVKKPDGGYLAVTAAHVLQKLEGEQCLGVFRSAETQEGYQRLEVKLPIRQGGKPLWTRHPHLDVAVMDVTLPAKAAVASFELQQIASIKLAEDNKLHVGQEVFIPCYPAKLEANKAGWPILRKGSIATYPLTPLNSAETIFIDYSHFGGDSGSAVVAIIDNEPVVVALVFAMQRQSDRMVMPFEDRTVHTPLGLAIAVQAPFIRSAIEMHLSKPDPGQK